MFAHRFFPSRFFPARFFPPKTGTTPAFVQIKANNANPAATLDVTFDNATVAGNAIVVGIEYNDTTHVVTGVTDSQGNSYSSAIGPTSGTGVRQYIYYATNIAGGACTVHVAWDAGAAFAEVMACEYSGIGNLDQVKGASGTTTLADTGNAPSTTVASELVAAFCTVSSHATAAGTGYTLRLIPGVYGGGAEDKVVAATGAYNATFAVSGTPNWVAQLATFYAQAGPTITSLDVTSGPVAGGTAVTVTGTGFLTGTTVTFGGTTAGSIVVVGPTSITCTTPAKAAGVYSVAVATRDGQSDTLIDAFTFAAAPTVASIDVSTGPSAGGTSVTVTGTGFASGATVAFGGTSATGVTVVNSTTITCTTAAHAVGLVSVVVTNTDTQTGTLSNAFTYSAPTVTSCTPNAGSPLGGTSVTLVGTFFASGATVAFGVTAATGVTVVDQQTITCTTPAHAAGAVNVVVTNTDAVTGTLTSGFTFLAAPTVTSVTANSGPTAGGTAVSVAGTGFVTGAGVTFGGVAATSVVVVSSTVITCLTPTHAAGAVTVVVTNPDTTNGSLSNAFTFLAAPTLVSLDVTSGPDTGGTVVTLTGTAFVMGATVSFASSAASGVTWVDSLTLRATTPPHIAGVVDVTVVNPDTQATTLFASYTYTASVVVDPGALVPASVPARMEVQGFVSSLNNDAVLIQTATIGASLTAGDTQVVAAPPAGYFCRVMALKLGNTGSASAANTFTFLSGAASLSPTWSVGANGHLDLEWADGGWFDCNEAEAFNVNVGTTQTANQTTELLVLYGMFPKGL